MALLLDLPPYVHVSYGGNRAWCEKFPGHGIPLDVEFHFALWIHIGRCIYEPVGNVEAIVFGGVGGRYATPGICALEDAAQMRFGEDEDRFLIV
jgi:hypothetical protein